MSPTSATIRITIGLESFSARFRDDLAPHSCEQLLRLLPYSGEIMHARWSGEAMWSRLQAVWPRDLCLAPECATGNPTQGDLLLYAGDRSEPELLVVYGACRFACRDGSLEGNPVLTIDNGLDRLADLGRATLQRGATSIRIETTDEFRPAALSVVSGTSAARNLEMKTLNGKNVVVLGAGGGLGAAIVRRAAGEGARTLAVARGLTYELEGGDTLKLDATASDSPAQVFKALRPDILVVCGGARPPMAAIHELSWSQFAANWETDVKMSFLFCQAALTEPLAPGSIVILISSGAAVGGSPISGGYAGAKRTQMFIANYCQKESDRLGLGIRFIALVPSMIMPETALGKRAVDGYAKYLGVSASDFVSSMKEPQTVDDVVNAVIEFATTPPAAEQGANFSVSSHGIAKV